MDCVFRLDGELTVPCDRPECAAGTFAEMCATGADSSTYSGTLLTDVWPLGRTKTAVRSTVDSIRGTGYG